jgi:hypothetical protein
MPKGRKIDLTATNYANVFHCKIYPNWDYWFQNMPSGNPALKARNKLQQGKFFKSEKNILWAGLRTIILQFQIFKKTFGSEIFGLLD